jgi:phosphoribosylformylglycinamidine synthase
MIARVFVTLKPGVLDPAGKAVEQSLHSLGFGEVGAVRLGKYIELSIDGQDAKAVKAQAEQMCQKLLANTVVENYRVEVG